MKCPKLSDRPLMVMWRTRRAVSKFLIQKSLGVDFIIHDNFPPCNRPQLLPQLEVSTWAALKHCRPPAPIGRPLLPQKYHRRSLKFVASGKSGLVFLCHGLPYSFPCLGISLLPGRWRILCLLRRLPIGYEIVCQPWLISSQICSKPEICTQISLLLEAG